MQRLIEIFCFRIFAHQRHLILSPNLVHRVIDQRTENESYY